MIEGAGRELFFVRAFGFFWRERFFEVSLRRRIRIEGVFPGRSDLSSCDSFQAFFIGIRTQFPVFVDRVGGILCPDAGSVDPGIFNVSFF